MLRYSALFAMLLLLTACFSVGDFGPYWAQAQIDPALTGRWQKLPYDKSAGRGEHLIFTERDGTHEVNGFMHGEPAVDEPLYPVKAVTFGHYHFLLHLAHSPGGDMVRYTLKDHELIFYMAQPTAQAALPNPPATLKYEDYYSIPIPITQLDDATARWLASLPADEKFWHRDAIYRQVP